MYIKLFNVELLCSINVLNFSLNIIIYAYNDMIGLLLTSQLHNALQLSAWCLHFISSNFSVYNEREELNFAMITGIIVIITIIIL